MFLPAVLSSSALCTTRALALATRGIAVKVPVLTYEERRAYPHIGNREIVGYGGRGMVNYMDDYLFPFPAIRFRYENGCIFFSILVQC